MDIQAFLKESSMQDLGWLQEGLTYNPKDNSKKNNVKPEAEKQWGYEKIKPKLNQPDAGEVKRNLTDDNTSAKNEVILFARDLMNQGLDITSVEKQINAKFAKPTITAAAKELNHLASMDGMIGKFVLDANGYQNCKVAMKSIKNSPYKGLIKFVIGCHCGDYHYLESSDSKSMKLASSSGNSFDDFFSRDTAHMKKMVAHCQSTLIPVLARGDLDEEWLNEGLIELEANFGLKAADKKAVKAAKVDAVSKLKMAFQLIDRRKKESAVARKQPIANNNEFKLKAALMPVELQQPAKPPVAVELAGYEIADALTPAPKVELPEIKKINMVKQILPFELNNKPELSPVPDVNLNKGGNFAVNEKPVFVDQAIKLSRPELQVQTTELKNPEIEMGGFVDEEFVGSDNIELDTVKIAKPVERVSFSGGFSW